jgi:hypothetical protein
VRQRERREHPGPAAVHGETLLARDVDGRAHSIPAAALASFVPGPAPSRALDQRAPGDPSRCNSFVGCSTHGPAGRQPLTTSQTQGAMQSVGGEPASGNAASMAGSILPASRGSTHTAPASTSCGPASPAFVPASFDDSTGTHCPYRQARPLPIAAQAASSAHVARQRRSCTRLHRSKRRLHW